MPILALKTTLWCLRRNYRARKLNASKSASFLLTRQHHDPLQLLLMALRDGFDDGRWVVASDDFCLFHGLDFMKTNRGPIPYCQACEDGICTCCRGECGQVIIVPVCCGMATSSGECCGNPAPAQEIEPCPNCGGSGKEPPLDQNEIEATHGPSS